MNFAIQPREHLPTVLYSIGGNQVKFYLVAL